VTKALPFTQASLRRAIQAARKEGLCVKGIRPDGTLVVNDGDAAGEPIVARVPEGQANDASKWEDVQA
jgi:hypothetical protein